MEMKPLLLKFQILTLKPFLIKTANEISETVLTTRKK